MKRILLLSLALSALLLSGCNGDQPARSEAAPAPSAEPGKRTAEPGTASKARSAETFVARSAARRSALTGFTRARNSMTLVTEESGRVHKVVADVGDTLGEHGLFAELDTTFIELDLAGNRADQQRLKSDVAYNKKEMDRYQALVQSLSLIHI
eukprot:TRINITY_DN13607_c0_g1_i2.p4 TRINITY_DN13607_c0_g1~~TRINITY_DN13607_c0_g1_i2.p4  ORF type:complete len:153 (-),score=77.65 TRINITY_DN13607_c0_g1_i2:82-540(-)